jgi:hypothetical protein
MSYKVVNKYKIETYTRFIPRGTIFDVLYEDREFYTLSYGDDKLISNISKINFEYYKET